MSELPDFAHMQESFSCLASETSKLQNAACIQDGSAILTAINQLEVRLDTRFNQLEARLDTRLMEMDTRLVRMETRQLAS
jgi:hypothetical protein